MTTLHPLAILLACLTVVVLSFLDFHSPYRVADVRYAVLRSRYYFALGIYATLALVVYLAIVELFMIIILAAVPHGGAAAGIVVAFEFVLIATILIFVLAPRLPVVGDFVAKVRAVMQILARYPQSAETVSALIARAPFAPAPRSRSELIRELSRYGVPVTLIEAALASDINVLSHAAACLLQEATSLRLCFAQLQDDRRFQRFSLARLDALGQLDKDYRRLIRRAARIILLAEEGGASGASTEVTLDISEFVAEECELLRCRYQRLLAEAALSCLPGPAARTKLIASFGYDAHLRHGLPLTPMVVVFVLDFLISFAPVIFLPFPAEAQMAKAGAAALSLAHACAITVALFWAVFPKVVGNFARPSLYTLPWSSYLLFGLVSYLCGDAMLYVALRIFHAPPGLLAGKEPLVASSLFSMVFLVTTVTVSILLDLRLRNESYDYRRARLRDGIVLALTMGATVILLQVALAVLTPMFGLTSPAFAIETRAVFTALYALLGFAMGLIPSTAEAHLEANKILLSAAEPGGKLISPFAPRPEPQLAAAPAG